MSNRTRIVVMGCGGSGGVPYAGNVWLKCDPNNSKNYRTRPSIYIEQGDTRIVVDTGPDFRNQINKVIPSPHLTAVLYTHAHVDHILGLDDLRSFFVNNGKNPISIYATPDTFKAIKHRFDYAFEQLNDLYPATVKPHDLPEKLIFNGLEIESIEQIHGDIVTTGFRIGDFAYSTDVSDFSPQSLEKLKGVKTWIVGSYPTEEGMYNHAGLNKIREWQSIINPKIIYLTHMTANADYETLCNELPPNIRPAYDGLEIIL